METHPVKLPAETALEFGVFWCTGWKGAELLHEEITILHIALIEREVVREHGVTKPWESQEVLVVFGSVEIGHICFWEGVRFCRRGRYQALGSYHPSSSWQGRPHHRVRAQSGPLQVCGGVHQLSDRRCWRGLRRLGGCHLGRG